MVKSPIPKSTSLELASPCPFQYINSRCYHIGCPICEASKLLTKNARNHYLVTDQEIIDILYDSDTGWICGDTTFSRSKPFITTRPIITPKKRDRSPQKYLPQSIPTKVLNLENEFRNPFYGVPAFEILSEPEEIDQNIQGDRKTSTVDSGFSEPPKSSNSNSTSSNENNKKYNPKNPLKNNPFMFLNNLRRDSNATDTSDRKPLLEIDEEDLRPSRRTSNVSVSSLTTSLIDKLKAVNRSVDKLKSKSDNSESSTDSIKSIIEEVRQELTIKEKEEPLIKLDQDYNSNYSSDEKEGENIEEEAEEEMEEASDNQQSDSIRSISSEEDVSIDQVANHCRKNSAIFLEIPKARSGSPHSFLKCRSPSKSIDDPSELFQLNDPQPRKSCTVSINDTLEYFEYSPSSEKLSQTHSPTNNDVFEKVRTRSDSDSEKSLLTRARPSSLKKTVVKNANVSASKLLKSNSLQTCSPLTNNSDYGGRDQCSVDQPRLHHMSHSTAGGMDYRDQNQTNNRRGTFTRSLSNAEAPADDKAGNVFKDFY